MPLESSQSTSNLNMKSATIFLVAVTVFTTLVPESTTTLVDNVVKDVSGIAGNTITGVLNITDNTVLDMSTLKQAIDKALGAINQTASGDVNVELKKKVYYRTNRAEFIFGDLIAYVQKVAAKIDGVQNVVLAKTLVQLRELQGVAIVVHPSLKLAVNSGNNLALKINADILGVVIAVAKAEFAEMVTSLEQTPGEVAAVAKTEVQRGASEIVALAEVDFEAINKVLIDRGYIEA